MEDDLRRTSRKQAVQSLNAASAAPKPSIGKLFSDVYEELPWNLEEQQDEIAQHMARYPEHYSEWSVRS